MKYKLSKSVCNNIFLINHSQLEGRLDPNTYHNERLSAIDKLVKSKSSLKRLKYISSFDKNIVTEIPSDSIYVGLENIQSNTGEYYTTTDKESISSAILFKKGDVLFPKLRPNLNKVYYAEFDGICSTEFHILNSDILDNKYLTYFLRSNLVVNQTKRLMSGNTLPRLQTSDIYNLLIPIKTPKTEKMIIGIMYDAYEKKKNKEHKAKELLESIDEYLLDELGIKIPEKANSLLNRIFTTTFKKVSGNRIDPKIYSKHSQALIASIDKSKYPTTALKNLITHSVAGNWGIDENIIDEDYDKCLVIRATEFDNNFNLNLVNDRLKYRQINKEKLAQLDIQENDLLIEKSGGSPDQPVGRIAIITNEILSEYKICYSNFVHKIRIDATKILPEYLFCFLKTIHNIKITDTTVRL
jgi:type I restriction enzyme S subunit